MGKSNKFVVKNKSDSKKADIFIIIGIVFLIGSLILMFVKSDKTDNHIKEISYSQYQNIVMKDEYSIILLTTPTCSHCVNYKPYVNYAADENNLTIYNINLQNLKYEEYVEIHDTYSAIMHEVDDNGDPSIPTPCTIIVRNGEEVDSIMGDVGYNGFINLLKENKIIK